MSENSSASKHGTATYRIGAVCRLTGLSPHVLRVWEKRYRVVEPDRGANQRRLYDEADIHKLSLLKSLVDRGHAIGSIADLDVAALEQRLAQSSPMSRPGAARETPRLAFIGEGLTGLAESAMDGEVYDCVGRFGTEDAFRDAKIEPDVDVLVIEQDNLYPDSGAEADRLRARLRARFLVLVYAYGSRLAVDRLRSEHLAALRAPLDPAALNALIAWRFALAERSSITDDTLPGLAPARKFNNRELDYLATLGTDIACECPRHLAQLVDSLTRFEAYSAQCESRNNDDAELHAYLYRVTAQVRSRMEQALERVIEMENLATAPDS